TNSLRTRSVAARRRKRAKSRCEGSVLPTWPDSARKEHALARPGYEIDERSRSTSGGSVGRQCTWVVDTKSRNRRVRDDPQSASNCCIRRSRVHRQTCESNRSDADGSIDPGGTQGWRSRK